MLSYICLLSLIASTLAQGQQVPSALATPGVNMPTLPAGASLLGTVAANAGPQPVQGAAIPAGNSFFQQTPIFGAHPMISGPQQVMARPMVGSPVPPPSVGPLASLAARQTLANSLVSTQRGGSGSGFNPLLLALGGGNDNFLPMYLMSQPGLFQKNPFMGMMMMQNM